MQTIKITTGAVEIEITTEPGISIAAPTLEIPKVEEVVAPAKRGPKPKADKAPGGKRRHYTDEELAAIKKMYELGHGPKEIARKMDVSEGAMTNMLYRMKAKGELPERQKHGA